MVPVDRNGANCSRPARLAAAISFRYDDQVQYEPLLLLSPRVGVRPGEIATPFPASSAQTHLRAESRGGFFHARHPCKTHVTQERERKEQCRSASTISHLISLPKPRRAQSTSMSGSATTGRCFSPTPRTSLRSAPPSLARWRTWSRSLPHA